MNRANSFLSCRAVAQREQQHKIVHLNEFICILAPILLHHRMFSTIFFAQWHITISLDLRELLLAESRAVVISKSDMAAVIWCVQICYRCRACIIMPSTNKYTLLLPNLPCCEPLDGTWLQTIIVFSCNWTDNSLTHSCLCCAGFVTLAGQLPHT